MNWLLIYHDWRYNLLRFHWRRWMRIEPQTFPWENQCAGPRIMVTQLCAQDPNWKRETWVQQGNSRHVQYRQHGREFGTHSPSEKAKRGGVAMRGRLYRACPGGVYPHSMATALIMVTKQAPFLNYELKKHEFLHPIMHCVLWEVPTFTPMVAESVLHPLILPTIL